MIDEMHTGHGGCPKAKKAQITQMMRKSQGGKCPVKYPFLKKIQF